MCWSRSWPSASIRRTNAKSDGIKTGRVPRSMSSARRRFPAGIRISSPAAIRTARRKAMAATPTGSWRPSATTIPTTSSAPPNRGRRPMGGDEVVGPDRAGEPVFDLVHLREHLLLIAPFENGEHGAEDLLLGDAHIHGHVGEHRRLDVEALGEMRFARTLAAAE